GLLREVRVNAALVDLELGGHLAAELGLGEHALDGLFDDGLRTAGEQVQERFFAEAAGVAGIAAIELGVSLEPGQMNLLSVNNDDVVAGIDIRGVERAVLAAEHVGYGGGEAAERLAGGVDEVPLALEVFT